jgi:hypothetical protein
LDVRALGSDPSLIALAGALLALNVAVHLGAAMLARQPLGAGLLATAQLGVPAAVVSLGLSERVLKPGQGSAIVVAALGSLAVCSWGAAILGRPGNGQPKSAGTE